MAGSERTGTPGAPPSLADLPRWVLHDHRVPRRHRDLRLELDGVLVSWAVPRGLPGPGDGNRLAVHVPDHDLDHLGYSDADKSVEDTGRFLLHERAERKLVVSLAGRVGVATYALVATRGDDWILHRMAESDRRHRLAAAAFASMWPAADGPHPGDPSSG